MTWTVGLNLPSPPPLTAVTANDSAHPLFAVNNLIVATSVAIARPAVSVVGISASVAGTSVSVVGTSVSGVVTSVPVVATSDSVVVTSDSVVVTSDSVVRASDSVVGASDSIVGTSVPGVCLGAGVGFVVDFLQPLGRDVRVDLGGGEAGVAEQFLDAP